MNTTVGDMDTNPYTSPTIPTDDLPKRLYTRPRLLLDVFAIVFAIFPIGFRITIDVVPYHDFERVFLPIAVLFLLTMLLWLVSLVINIVGTVKTRPVSIIGVLINIASFIAIL
jgi:hypothetical protein